jgi:hypothetical protein
MTAPTEKVADPVVVASSDDAAWAELAALRLRQAGIEALVFGTNAWDHFDGIQVVVPGADVERARPILAQLQQSPPQCPTCGSFDIVVRPCNRLLQWLALPLALLGMPLVHDRCRCRDCHYAWRVSRWAGGRRWTKA